MAVYADKAVDQGGKSTRGFVDAESDSRRAREAAPRRRLPDRHLAEHRPRRPKAGADRRARGLAAKPLVLARRVASGSPATDHRDRDASARNAAVGAGVPLDRSARRAHGAGRELPSLKGVFGVGARPRERRQRRLADALSETSGPFSEHVRLAWCAPARPAVRSSTVLQRLADYLEEPGAHAQNKVPSRSWSIRS